MPVSFLTAAHNGYPLLVPAGLRDYAAGGQNKKDCIPAMNRLVKFLEAPQAARIIVLLALLFTSPALVVGYFGDDYMHHALLSPAKPFPTPDDGSLFGLFSFINGDPVRNQLLRDYSLLSWWSYDALKFTFWRPVTEITHWIDHRLWHNSPALMHVHSLLWYALLCTLVGFLYRRLSSAPLAAGAALLVFALDSTHGFGVGWISNRNSLIAATFGMASLLTYIRWRETDQRSLQLVSLLCLALSLLSAEAGISATAYLGAYALVLDKRGTVRGLLSLWPHVLIAACWWVTYKQLGFGAVNADAYYIDPAHSPALFALKLLERIPVMLASLFGLIPAELYGFAGKPIPAYVVVCAIFVAVVLALMRKVLQLHATARFWLLGSLFALVPVATALPHDRNLLFASIGGAMLIGELFRHWMLAPRAVTLSGRLTTGVIVAFLSLHLLVSPLLLPLMAYSPRIWTSQMQLEAIQLPPLENLTEKSILLLGAPLPAALGMIPMRYAENLPLPARLWTITSRQKPLTLTRVSDNELVIDSADGFVNEVEESLRNTERFPFAAGDQIPHTGMTIEVLSINDKAKPASLKLRFDPDRLASTVILQWQKDHYETLSLPEVGTSLPITWPPNS